MTVDHGSRENNAQVDTLALRICSAFQCIEADVLAVSRALSLTEQALAKKVGVQDVERVRLSIWSEWPEHARQTMTQAATVLFSNSDAIRGFAFDQYVVLKFSDFEPTLLAHELRHVTQWEQYGNRFEYMTEYIRQIIESGYRNSFFERDARAFESFAK